jgi:hypothetical protein
MTLQDLVERLAAPHVEEAKVIDRDTNQPETRTITRRALLDDLEDTVGVSTGGGGNAGGSRILVDAEVVKLKASIGGDLARDMLRLGITAFRFGSLATQLTAWHAAFQASFPNGAEEYAWVEQLGRWETQIRAVTEPVKKREVTEPCPICGASETYVEDERRSMLTITYSEDSPAASTELECGRCGVLAQGVAAVAATLNIEKVHNTQA